ncbi:MAG: hypothetical protein ACR2PX_09450 [Endozoicomonas sp.]|uniref:hypothetical protein n=1 Tax=Endozoicomonas sp. TaxID=1892382 RepID=UPI003D9BE3DA
MLATHRDAENRYSIIREAVLDQVNQDFANRGEINNRVKLIDNTALTQSKNWDYSSKRRVDWDWVEGYANFKFRYPKRFEMALWHSGKLASLTLGRPTYTGQRMRLDLIEACPEKPADLKVFEISLFAIGIYAETLGAHELRIMNPINTQVRDYYARFGLTYVPAGDYLYATL